MGRRLSRKPHRPIIPSPDSPADGTEPAHVGSTRRKSCRARRERRRQPLGSWPCAWPELDPNHTDAWATRAKITACAGQPAATIEQVQRALRLDPHPAAWHYWELGLAQYAGRQYESAVETLRKAVTYRSGSRRILAASLAQLGRMTEARRETELYMASNPHFTIQFWASTQPFRDDAMREHFVDGYRKAGLPE